MRGTYDPEADALSIELVPEAKRGRTVRVEPGVLAHFDKADRLIEIEILMASTKYDRAELEDFASPEELLSLVDAAKEAGLEPVTLRVQIAKGKIKATKKGRDWMVSRAELYNYMENREASGRKARSRKGRKLRNVYQVADKEQPEGRFYQKNKDQPEGKRFHQNPQKGRSGKGSTLTKHPSGAWNPEHGRGPSATG